jgi:serine/threonine protein kinase
MIHGDVKPGNMLVGHDGRAYLADFGLAETLVPGRQPTNLGRPRGTLLYMAPECRDGGEIGPHSDQFSFCLSLWEALCGERPEGADLSPARGDVPTQLEQVIRRGLSARPRDRFPEMGELPDALVKVQQAR